MITPEAMRTLADKLDEAMKGYDCSQEAFEAVGMLRSIAAEREAEAKRNEVKRWRENYIFEYEQEHGKGSFDATGE